jgi:intein/homing endonuclease
MRKSELLAYTAGFMDGEGSIQINPSKSASNKRYWGLTVQVSSCNIEVLEWLRLSWNGIGTIHSWNPNKGRAKQQSHNWRIYSKQAEYLLKKIQPYLQIKSENARVALEFRKLTGFTRGQITEKIASQRLFLATQMRDLNRRYGKGKIKIVKHDYITI